MTKKGDCREKGGKQRYRSERIHASFFSPPPSLLRGHRLSTPPPKPAYLRAFRTVLFAFSLSANWNSRSLRFTLRVLLLCSFSLFLSLSTSSFSAILIIIASRPAHPRLFVICLSPCRHSSPFSQLYYIALLFFFTAASTREEGRKIVTLWLNEVRALLKFRSLATE